MRYAILAYQMSLFYNLLFHGFSSADNTVNLLIILNIYICDAISRTHDTAILSSTKMIINQ